MTPLKRAALPLVVVSVVIFALGASAVPTTAQVAARNRIVVRKVLEGTPPPGSVFTVAVSCSTYDAATGTSTTILDQTVSFDALGNPPGYSFDVPTHDASDATVSCSITETQGFSPPPSPRPPSIVNPYGCEIVDVGTNIPADGRTPACEYSRANTQVSFPASVQDAIANLSVVNYFAAPVPPEEAPTEVTLAPTFTG